MVVDLRKYFSDAANESYGTDVCVWVCVMDLYG
jgi:hypothetical protein